jgi:MFS family permease
MIRTYASAAPVIYVLGIAEHFHKSTTFGYLITSMFCHLSPWKSHSFAVACELFGRRAVNIVAFPIYVLTFIGQAWAHNMETLLIMRFFGGVFGSAPLMTGGGLLADMWGVSGRTIPSAIFLTGVVIGPCIATVTGGL